MIEEQEDEMHAAEAAALGFYFQTFFALLMLLRYDSDNAAVGVEQMDDIDLKADGQRLLVQLKHSISATPPPMTLKSRALWRTMKVWIDALPALTLSETVLHLVAVASIPPDSPLMALTSLDDEREGLVTVMTSEAQRVVDVRAAAATSGKALPYADRVDGCEAFLFLSETERLNLLRRTLIKHGSLSIGEIEVEVAGELKLVPADQRPMLAKRLIEWWDRQIVYSLCAKRERVISRTELQQEITSIIGDIEQNKLLPDFESVSQPENYQPDGMLARQIRLVEGRSSDLSRAIREEWRAREQRSKWLNEKPSMAVVIGEYDRVLAEHWADNHGQMVEECAELVDNEKRSRGLAILRWTHEEAPNIVRPIADGWNAPYYVRGSYQVLAINLKVGWHPDYAALLEDDE